MFPRYIILNHLVINFYGLFVSLGILSAIFILNRTGPDRELEVRRLRSFCLMMLISGLIGSRIFYVIFHWDEFQGRSWLHMAAFWRGGLMFQGGPILAVALSPFFLAKYRLGFWPTADVLAPSLALGQGVGRIGCFFAGCCHGRLTSPDNPLAITFPARSLGPAGVPLWPTQLMESASLLILFVLTYNLLKNRGLKVGMVAGIYLAASGMIRFVIDMFRGDDRGLIFDRIPATSIIAFGIFLLGLFIIINKNKTNKYSYTAEYK